MMCYFFIASLNASLLFYIYLFAAQQSAKRQEAWFKSFMVWIIFEIVVVSTMSVVLTHIFIPSIIMKDVIKIKKKLVATLEDHMKKQNIGQQYLVSASCGENDAESKLATTNEPLLNATEYFFVSTRIAKLRPALPQSKIILAFSTPWPHQSYQHSNDVSAQYSKKFSFLTHAASIVMMYLISSLLALPPTVQDIIVQITTTSGIGYVLTLLVDIYRINPALPIAPVVALIGVVWLMVSAGQEGKELSELKKRIISAGDAANPGVTEGNSKPAMANDRLHISASSKALDGAESCHSQLQMSSSSIVEEKVNFEELEEGFMSNPNTPTKSSIPPAIVPRTRRQSVGMAWNVMRQLRESEADLTESTSPLAIIEGGNESIGGEVPDDSGTSESDSESDECVDEEDDDDEKYFDVMRVMEAQSMLFLQMRGRLDQQADDPVPVGVVVPEEQKCDESRRTSDIVVDSKSNGTGKCDDKFVLTDDILTFLDSSDAAGDSEEADVSGQVHPTATESPLLVQCTVVSDVPLSARISQHQAEEKLRDTQHSDEKVEMMGRARTFSEKSCGDEALDVLANLPSKTWSVDSVATFEAIGEEDIDVWALIDSTEDDDM
jgi:hypothetical protein